MHYAILAGLAAALVSGCGGGGGEDMTTPAPALTFNIDAAMTSAFTKGATTGDLHAILFDTPYAASERFNPATDSEMRGVTYRRTFDTMVMRSGATTLGSDSATLYFTTGPLQLAYSEGSSGLAVYTPVGALPTAAQIGQSGIWNNQQIVDRYGNASASITQTWSLEPDTTETTALACIRFDEPSESSWSTRSGASCYRIDQAGNVLPGGRFTVTINGKTATYQ
jgi:hypothetical protein